MTPEEIKNVLDGWQKTNAEKLNTLNNAQKEAVNVALSFLNSKFGGKGEYKLKQKRQKKVEEIVKEDLTPKTDLIRISKITDVWVQFAGSESPLPIFTNWDSINEAFKEYYYDVPIPTEGYDKWKIELEWEDGSRIVDRIDVGASNYSDFNPLNENFSDFIYRTYSKPNNTVMYLSDLKIKDINKYDIGQTASTFVEKKLPKVGDYYVYEVGENNRNLMVRIENVYRKNDNVIVEYKMQQSGDNVHIPLHQFETEFTLSENAPLNSYGYYAFRDDNFDVIKIYQINKIYLYKNPNEIMYKINEYTPDGMFEKMFYMEELEFDMELETASTYEISQDINTFITRTTSVVTSEEEDDISIADLDELENDIESINFEELDKIDEELDNLF